MEINVTIVLQIIQFMCVYLCLYTFLFVPASKILEDQEQNKNDLYKKLEEAQQIKDALLQDYHVKNDAFKSVLLKNIPDQAVQLEYQQMIHPQQVDHVDHPELSQTEKDTIKLFLVDSLSKVVHK